MTAQHDIQSLKEMGREISAELTHAIRSKEGLCLSYQPKLEVNSGKLAGAEAVVRWSHPVRGTLNPLHFMSMVPQALCIELEQWMIGIVCRDIQCWQQAGLKPIQISLNISHRHLDSRGISELAETLNFNRKNLHVGIEESAMLYYGGDSSDVLSRVRETSIEVQLSALEDNPSSMKFLSRYPLNAIKIERYGSAAGISERQSLLLDALSDLGLQLGMRITADSPETPEQEATLEALKGKQMQGVVNSKPLPFQDFMSWAGQEGT